MKKNLDKNEINNKKIKKRNFKEGLANFGTKLVIFIMLIIMIGFYIIQLIRGY